MSASVSIGSRFAAAVEFAIDAHQGDVRKGTTIPYLSHLLQVAGLVLEYGGTEEEAIGAMLHDAAEDAGGEAMLAEIESRFGSVVESIVRENSDSLTESKEAKAPWRQRKEAYVFAISHKSESACLVSICDKIHNCRSLIADTRNHGEVHWQRFNAGKDEVFWYYSSLLEAFAGRLADAPRLRTAFHELQIATSELGLLIRDA